MCISEQKLESHCIGPSFVALHPSAMRPRLQQLLCIGLRMKKTCGANHWAMAMTQTEECTFVKHPKKVWSRNFKGRDVWPIVCHQMAANKTPSGVRKWQYSRANWAGVSIQTSSCCPRCNWAWFWKRHHSKQVKNHHTHKAYCQQYPHASIPSAFHPTKLINLITHTTIKTDKKLDSFPTV